MVFELEGFEEVLELFVALLNEDVLVSASSSFSDEELVNAELELFVLLFVVFWLFDDVIDDAKSAPSKYSFPPMPISYIFQVDLSPNPINDGENTTISPFSSKLTFIVSPPKEISLPLRICPLNVEIAK